MRERFFGEGASSYARRARRLIPFYDELHSAVARELHGVESLLSVGCGDGEDLARSAAARRVGVDPSPDMIAMAQERLGEGAQLIVGDADDLDGTYEAVVAVLVGHFVPFEARDSFYASLRSRCEGKLVVTEIVAPVDADGWVEAMIANGTDDSKARSAVSNAMAELFPFPSEELVASVERAGFQFQSEFWATAPFAAFSFRAL